MFANNRHLLSCINLDRELDDLVAMDSLSKTMLTMRVTRFLERSTRRARRNLLGLDPTARKNFASARSVRISNGNF